MSKEISFEYNKEKDCQVFAEALYWIKVGRSTVGCLTTLANPIAGTISCINLAKTLINSDGNKQGYDEFCHWSYEKIGISDFAVKVKITLTAPKEKKSKLQKIKEEVEQTSIPKDKIHSPPPTRRKQSNKKDNQLISFNKQHTMPNNNQAFQAQKEILIQIKNDLQKFNEALNKISKGYSKKLEDCHQEGLMKEWYDDLNDNYCVRTQKLIGDLIIKIESEDIKKMGHYINECDRQITGG